MIWMNLFYVIFSGLHLSEEIQKEVKKIKKRMSELSIKFQRNLNEDNTKLFFTREELAGMPEDFIDDLTQVTFLCLKVHVSWNWNIYNVNL